MAESALVASEADFRSLFEHMSEGFAYHEIVLREDGRPVDYVFLDVNEAFCELTGLEREAVLGRRVTEVIPGLEPRWIETYGRVALSGEPAEFEDWSEALGKCFSVAAYRPEPGKFACVFVDITDRKRSEARQRLITEVLAILNEPEDFQDAMRRVVAHLKTYTGFDAVGLRMWDNGDFPYSAQEGFPQDFLLKENTLTERGPDGGVCRDRDGNVKLECTCGLVLSGKVPSSHPLFTAGGSFWTNDSLPLLDLAPDEDPRHHPRNECIHRGYASVALIPLRSGAERIGLLQLNDKRPDRLTLELVNLLESLGNTIGIALAHKRAEEALAESERMYRALFGSAGDAVLVLHADR
ncbi:MAG: PAS domain S-box protein, partial [Armatimonadota bacterium]